MGATGPGDGTSGGDSCKTGVMHTRAARMQPIDVAKAAGVALAIMVVNVTISVVVMIVYSYAVDPGHDAAYYEAAAQRIAPWSSVVFGAPLFFFATYRLAQARPERNAARFAVAVFGFYAAVDLLALVAAGSVGSLLGVVALSLTTKLVGALAGARLASRAASS